MELNETGSVPPVDWAKVFVSQLKHCAVCGALCHESEAELHKNWHNYLTTALDAALAAARDIQQFKPRMS